MFLLNDKYNEITENNNNQIEKSKYVCITSDGWTNNRNESIINFMVTLPKPLFWKALETKESLHTAEYISEKLEEVISEVGQDKVVAVLTDNAANMKKAHKILNNKFNKIIFIGIFFYKCLN